MPIRPFPTTKSKFRSQEFIGGDPFQRRARLPGRLHRRWSTRQSRPAGYGVVIEDEIGRPVAELSEYLGRQTNNYAEYSGLLAALSYAIKHDFKALKVVSDSELMVKQINGEYKVNSPTLKELNAQAMKLIDQLDCFEIRHVLREKNKEADRLANLAMDRGTFHKAPAMRPEAVATSPREVNGVVRGGTVQFLGDPFPGGNAGEDRAAK